LKHVIESGLASQSRDERYGQVQQKNCMRKTVTLNLTERPVDIHLEAGCVNTFFPEEARRVDYNQSRPHSSLGGLTPAEFKQQEELKYVQNL
jgi:transposase InsO family protein